MLILLWHIWSKLTLTALFYLNVYGLIIWKLLKIVREKNENLVCKPWKVRGEYYWESLRSQSSVMCLLDDPLLWVEMFLCHVNINDTLYHWIHCSLCSRYFRHLFKGGLWIYIGKWFGRRNIRSIIRSRCKFSLLILLEVTKDTSTNSKMSHLLNLVIFLWPVLWDFLSSTKHFCRGFTSILSDRRSRILIYWNVIRSSHMFFWHACMPDPILFYDFPYYCESVKSNVFLLICPLGCLYCRRFRSVSIRIWVRYFCCSRPLWFFWEINRFW